MVIYKDQFYGISFMHPWMYERNTIRKSGKTNYVLYTLWISCTNNVIRVQRLEYVGANGEKICRSAVIGCHPGSSVPRTLTCCSLPTSLILVEWYKNHPSSKLTLKHSPSLFGLTLASNQFSPACTTKTSDFICYMHINVPAFNRYGLKRNIINWKSLRRWRDVHLLTNCVFPPPLQRRT